MKPEKAKLKVTKIKNGTVIDHIRPGLSPTVLRILQIDRGFPHTVIAAMNVTSDKLGEGGKDVVKVENKKLSGQVLDKIAIVSPHATVNIIKDFKVSEKANVKLPPKLQGIVKCPNRNCITNSDERMSSYFMTESEDPIRLRCHYCEDLVSQEEVEIVS